MVTSATFYGQDRFGADADITVENHAASTSSPFTGIGDSLNHLFTRSTSSSVPNTRCLSADLGSASAEHLRWRLTVAFHSVLDQLDAFRGSITTSQAAAKLERTRSWLTQPSPSRVGEGQTAPASNSSNR